MRIPNITRNTYDLAHLCALALWNGINYETGKKQLISDASLLGNFGLKYINARNHGTPINFTLDEVTKFIKVTRLRHHINPLTVDLSSGKTSLNNTVLTFANRRFSNSLNYLEYQIGALLSENLGRHFANKRYVIRNGNRVRTVNNKTTLASRLLFFTVPNVQCFNLNEDVAKLLQLHGNRASAFNNEYCQAFATMLDRDWHTLSNYKMPTKTTEISQLVWNEAYKGCWWQRRVLDLAVLLRFKLIDASYIENYYCLAKPRLPNLFKKI